MVTHSHAVWGVCQETIVSTKARGCSAATGVLVQPTSTIAIAKLKRYFALFLDMGSLYRRDLNNLQSRATDFPPLVILTVFNIPNPIDTHEYVKKVVPD